MKRTILLLVILSLSVLCLWADPETEPNNTFDDTGVLTIINGDHTGEITAGDHDYWKFWAVAGDNITISCVNASTSFDTYLHLYDSSGIAELASNDDAGGTLQSQIDYSITNADWYYFNLRGYSNNAAGTYLVSLSGSTPNDPGMPGTPTNVVPTPGAFNVAINGTTLSWDWGANTETFDLYFGEGSLPATPVIADQAISGTGETYDPGVLDYAGTYYWQIVAKNSTSIYDNSLSGTFSTELGTDVIQIGNGTEVNQSLPIEPFYGYSYSQSVYLQSDIDIANQRIEKVYYQFNEAGPMANCNEWVIYMGHTPNSSFASTNDWIPISQLVQVYSGPLPAIGAEGWIEFVLQAPFVYNNTDNLVIAVEENQPQYCAGGSEDFLCDTTTGARSIFFYNDMTDPDPNAPPEAMGTPTAIPNTRLFFGDISPDAELMYYPDSHDYGILYTGSSTDPVTYTITNTGMADLVVQSVTMDNTTDFTLTDNNTYPLTISSTQLVNFEISFTPVNAGPLTCNVTITDDQNNTYPIALTGEGFDQTITVFPYTQDFDLEEAIPIGWDQGTEDEGDWFFNNWASWETGPQNGDHTGNGGFFARAQSNGNQGYRSDLLAPPVDVSALANPFCSFWYTLYGANVGELHFDLWDGTQWTEDIRPPLTGDQGQDWLIGDVDLNGNTGVVQLRFRYLGGPMWNGDVALDDISFWDNGSAPVPTTLVAPVDAAIEIPMTGTVEWNPVPGAAGYYVSMGTDNPPTDVYDMVDAGNNYTFDYSGLTAGVVYYWQVTPYNAIGSATNCPVWSFTTFNDIPNAATIVAPQDGSENQSITPILEWADGGNYPDGYRVYFGSDNPPTNIVDGVDAGFVNEYAITGPLAFETDYYWQIIPYNFVGDATGCPVWTFSTRPEGMVIIGDGVEENQFLPIEPYYGYSYSQSIYTPEEFGSAGFITSISYQFNGGGDLSSSTQWVVYMGLTDQESFDSTTSWIPYDQLTMVYNGTIANPTSAGWLDFTLENMFFYDGMSNLVIAVEENEPEYGDSTEDFYCTQTATPRSIYFYNDGTDPDPIAPPEAMFTPNLIPNTRFFMIPPSVGPYVILSALDVDFGVHNVGTTSDVYNIRIANFGQSDAVIDPAITLTGDDAGEFTLTDGNTYPISIPQFGEVSFDLTFNPTTAGHKEALITIVDNVTDSREVHEIPLHGYAYVADSNDQSDDATELVLDCEGLEAIIEPVTDIDWYAFWQAAPANLEIHTENLYGSNVDLSAFLYGPFDDLGQTVPEDQAMAFDDDSWTDGMNPYIATNITEAGFYYLRIARFDNSPAMDRVGKKNDGRTRWATGDYSLWVITDNHDEPDGFYPPTALAHDISYQGVTLSWMQPEEPTRSLAGYNVYRDDVIVNSEPVTAQFYLDTADDLTFDQSYEYKITALYTGPTGESPACDSINVVFTEVDPPVIADSFDTFDPFTTDLSPWITIDGDGEGTYGFNNGIDFTGENDPMAFIAFNPSMTVPPVQFADAYTGDQYLACFAADSGSNDDWLISQQVLLSNDPASLKFLARSYTIQFGNEQFEVGISNGSADPDDFTIITGDSPVDAPLDWTQFTYDLDAYAGQTIRVALHCVSSQTFFMMVDDMMLTNNGATVGEEEEVIVPTTTALRGNYPNPFNPETAISFDMKEAGNVSIDIYNVKGQKVKTLANDHYNAGRHSVIWDGVDDNNSSVSSGVYFYKMQSGTYTKSKKMILMK